MGVITMEIAKNEQKEQKDRRKKSRFAICRELRYKLVEGDVVIAHGTGETINMGSGGVSFIAERPLKPGVFVELSISWPVLLEESTRMRLVVFGRLLRSTNRTAACTMDKYEFRTQARVPNALPQVRRDGLLQRWVGESRRDLKVQEYAALNATPA